jgi:hypothetical protein
MDDVKELIPEFYINAIKLAMTAFDLTLELGVQEVPAVPDAPGGTMEVQSTMRPTVRIRMSPQYAIVLGKLIDKVMQDYQAKNGYLQLPNEILTKLGIIR